MPVEPAAYDEDDDARQAEAEQRQADHERTKMRPAPHREDPHDSNLERDHGARQQPHCQIERRTRGDGNRRSGRRCRHAAPLDQHYRIKTSVSNPATVLSAP